jgi:hypothetical protein
VKKLERAEMKLIHHLLALAQQVDRTKRDSINIAVQNYYVERMDYLI